MQGVGGLVVATAVLSMVCPPLCIVTVPLAVLLGIGSICSATGLLDEHGNWTWSREHKDRLKREAEAKAQRDKHEAFMLETIKWAREQRRRDRRQERAAAGLIPLPPKDRRHEISLARRAERKHAKIKLGYL